MNLPKGPNVDRQLSEGDLKRVRQILGGHDLGADWYQRMWDHAQAGERTRQQLRKLAARDLSVLGKQLRQVELTLNAIREEPWDYAALSGSSRVLPSVEGVPFAVDALQLAAGDLWSQVEDFVKTAEGLRVACVQAARGVSHNSGGRPRRRADQLNVIRVLAWLYEHSTRSAAKATNPEFVELVEIVLGLNKVEELIRKATLQRIPRTRRLFQVSRMV